MKKQQLFCLFLKYKIIFMTYFRLCMVLQRGHSPTPCSSPLPSVGLNPRFVQAEARVPRLAQIPELVSGSMGGGLTSPKPALCLPTTSFTFIGNSVPTAC